MALFVTRPVLAVVETSPFLTTVGVSTGVGAVLGLSTISFYPSPGQHLNNMWVGAGAGLLLGLGLAAYLAYAPHENEIDPQELMQRSTPQSFWFSPSLPRAHDRQEGFVFELQMLELRI